jgi:chorismate-pyruvate lyase
MKPLFLPKLVSWIVRCLAVDGSLTKILRNNTQNEFSTTLSVDVSELAFPTNAYTY